MRCFPIMGVLGFIFGCCITVIVAILFLPGNDFWPSVYEDKITYLKDLTQKYNFSYQPALYMYQNSLAKQPHRFESEEQLLVEKARMLCYSFESEADDITHASIIISTWARHCDKTVMFYTSSALLKVIRTKGNISDNIQLTHVDSANSTIATLLKVLQKEISKYRWFTYVPPRVFLLPDNLKYYLVASKMDPDKVTFLGKPAVSKLFGTWSVSDQGPLVMSSHSIADAANRGGCDSESIEDPGCIVEVTNGHLLNIRNSDGHEVITSVLYNNFWIKYGNIHVKNSIKMHFPVSVYVRGEYKNLMDLEYYFHHMAAYGVQSIQGGFTRPRT